MKIGLVSDIHNDATHLRRALEQLALRKVDHIITIGDTFDPMAEPKGMAEVAELLIECQAVGVWGNHDFIFCHETPDEYYTRYPAAIFEHLKRVTPSLVHANSSMGALHFSHREHFVDPFDPIALWDLTGETIDNHQRAERALANQSFAVQLVGHYHTWMAFDQNGPIPWNGQQPLHLAVDQRYFIVVAAVCDGWCAMLDDEERKLWPIRV